MGLRNGEEPGMKLSRQPGQLHLLGNLIDKKDHTKFLPRIVTAMLRLVGMKGRLAGNL